MKKLCSPLTAAVLIACAHWITVTTIGAEEVKPPTLENATLGETANVHAFGKTLLGSQPNQAALEEAKKLGVKIVVSLREEDEAGFDEAEAAKSAGLEFARIPFLTPETLDEKVFSSARKILEDSQKNPVLLYCGSGNRAGAIWAAHRALDDEISLEAALEEGKTVGMRSPDYKKIVQEYIQNNKK